MVLLPVEGRAETAMGTEYAVIYKRSEGKVVKKVGEVLPHPRSAVNSEAFVVETVYLQSPPPAHQHWSSPDLVPLDMPVHYTVKTCATIHTVKTCATIHFAIWESKKINS